MTTARLARARSGMPYQPRTAASVWTGSNKPPSVVSAGGPECSKKRLASRPTRRLVVSGASAYGTATAFDAPTRRDLRDRSVRPKICSATRSGGRPGAPA